MELLILFSALLSHTAIASGEQPPAFLVYTTGAGFPPVITGVPQALKGIATVMLLALLTGLSTHTLSQVGTAINIVLALFCMCS